MVLDKTKKECTIFYPMNQNCCKKNRSVEHPNHEIYGQGKWSQRHVI